MKKIKILSATIILVFTSLTFASAQDLKGQWIVGAKVLSISSSTNNFTMALAPSFGKYISNKVGIGWMLDYTYTKSKGEDALTDWGTGPFLKYYFLRFNDKNFLYTRARFLYGQSEVLYITEKGKKLIRDNFTTEGIGVGFTTILNNHLSLEFEPGIAFTQKKNLTHTDYTFDIRFEYRFGGQ